MKKRDVDVKTKNVTVNTDEIDIQACSAMDCTGLIPTPAQTEEERENYEELYPYLPKAASPAPKSK